MNEIPKTANSILQYKPQAAGWSQEEGITYISIMQNDRKLENTRSQPLAVQELTRR